MSQALKSMIVVLGIAALLFYAARPVLLRFSSAEECSRRRNLWMALTVVAFVSPSFWLFVLVAMPTLYVMGKKDSNPVALYMLLLHVIPPDSVRIPPPPGLNEFTGMDNYRVLMVSLLIPLALQLRRSVRDGKEPARKLTAVDWSVILFGLMNVWFFIPPNLPGQMVLSDSATNMLRRAFDYFLDTWLLFYVVSRSSSRLQTLKESIAWLCMGFALMASIATFETLKGWLVYTEVFGRWNNSGGGVYLLRGDSLRASASAGPSLILGVLLAVGSGLWVALMPRIDSMRTRIVVMAVFWAGLLASYSRGPWLGAIAMYMVYVAVGPRAMSKVFKGGLIAVVLGGLVLASPLGSRILKVMPFFGGTVDNFNVVYRRELLARSWEIIVQRPIFGDQLALFKMESLRQGQGIIDLVNTFSTVTLFYGFVGLALFLGGILAAAYRVFRRARQFDATEPETAAIGYALIGTIAGLLIMLWATSFFVGAEKMFYILAAFAVGYSHLKNTASAATAPLPKRSQRRGSAWAPVPAGSVPSQHAGK